MGCRLQSPPCNVRVDKHLPMVDNHRVTRGEVLVSQSVDDQMVIANEYICILAGHETIDE